MELIQNREGLVATLTVKISQEDYAAQVEKGLRKVRQTAQLKGFRRGNAPMSIIKKMYGSSLLVEEINKIIFEVIGNYEEENKEHLIGRVIPINNQQLTESDEEYKDLEFVYEAGFYPEFTYQIDENTELPYYNIIVEDTTIDEVIDYYRNAYQILENIDEVDDNCLICANVNVIKEGEEKTHTAKFIISVVPDEYKSLFSGTKVNDVINVEIRKVFTNENDLTSMLAINKDDLDLQPEILPFTIVSIEKSVPAKMDKEFFDMVSGQDSINTEEEFRDYVRNNIAADYEIMSLNRLYLDSIKILKEKIGFDLPRDYIEKYIRFMQKEDEDPTEEPFESYVQYFIDETKWKYIVQSLFTQNDISITPEMIQEEAETVIKETYSNYGYYDMDELVNYYLSNKEFLHNILTRSQRRQLANLLKQRAKLNVTDITADEFKAKYNNKEEEEQE
jgi:trigger factor